jgi:hypothetical protein
MADLEEQKLKLHQAKAEYEKIMSSGVSFIGYRQFTLMNANVCSDRHLSRSSRRRMQTSNEIERSFMTLCND